jgi:hypothetical protein
VSSYSVVPALPPGLTLSSASGVINGAPARAETAGSYVITASNSTGSTTFSLRSGQGGGHRNLLYDELWQCKDVYYTGSSNQRLK